MRLHPRRLKLILTKGSSKNHPCWRGSIGDFPERLDVDHLLKTDLNDESIVATVKTAITEIETVDDLHASAEYRKRGCRAFGS